MGFSMTGLHDIHIRDPFVVPAADESIYYLFGTNCAGSWGSREHGFQYFVSRDLRGWNGPFPAFLPPADFWAEGDFWAPEVHPYRGRWYLFGSLKAEQHCRATQIFVADHPRGPYRPHGDGPVTPSDWECLDGTLHVEADGSPWIVFCHEWVQVEEGTICAMPLTPDLRAPAGKPERLFGASDAPWCEPAREHNGKRFYVTDGPFLWRTAGGELLMLWSSFIREGGNNIYCQATAHSQSGSVHGPWIQSPTPLFAADGGHGMLFRAFDGQLMLALHSPNAYPHERPRFLPVSETIRLL